MMGIEEAKGRIENAATRKDRVMAEREMGFVLLQMESQGAFLSRGKRRTGEKLSLFDCNITAVQAHRWRLLASMSEDTFNDLLDRASARQRGPATGAIIELAKSSHRPASPVLEYINSFIFKAPQSDTRHGNAR